MYDYYGKHHDHVKVVPPNAVLIPHEDKTPYQFIETVGRTCYKSEDKITQDSAVSFVQRLVNNRHYAMLEHHWIHLIFTGNHDFFSNAIWEFSLYTNKCDSGFDLIKFWTITTGYPYTYVTMPLRAALELQDYIRDNMKEGVPNIIDQMLTCISRKYPELFAHNVNVGHQWSIVDEGTFKKRICEDYAVQESNACEYEVMKHIPHTVLFTCDRGISHELVRHRVASFGQESTRYCNYSKNKFGNAITVIKPFFFNRNPDTPDNVLYDDSTYSAWLVSMEHSAKAYFNLLNRGASPQEARSVLPNSLKTEIFITASEMEWQHIIDLRLKGVTGAPHPQMQEVMHIACPFLEQASEGRIKCDLEYGQ